MYVEPQNKFEIIQDINKCQRCGKNHKALKFKKLNNAIDDYKYWVTCPISLQPILLAINYNEQNFKGIRA